jgi:5-hydroxyisourate hydrolase-like protein (transthyretin family)
LGLFFGKDKNPWGIVYDATTNKPIPYASIRVFLKGTKTLVEQRITDSDGRYGMVLSAGKYRMEVEHTDYLKEELDINIESDNDVVPNDIELRPMDEEARKNEFRFSIKALFRALNQFLTENIGFMLYFGLATSLLAIFFSRNIFNVVMLVLYAIAALAYYFSKNRGLKKWGEVIDAENNLRIPYAIVKLFDRDTWKMIDTQMTNQNGSFGVFNEPGRYAILVSAKGYEFPSKRQTDLNSVKGKLGVLELDIYQNRELKVKLYVDPLKAGQKQSRVTTGSNYTDKTQSVARPGNLASPFN